MQYVVDLHLHSKYSRAVSPQMTLPVMVNLAHQKGLDILSSVDFTHPAWFAEINNLLEEAGEGIYKLKIENGELKTKKETLFLLSTEISSIYKQGGKLRRIHNLIFVPSLAIAKRLNQELTKRGCNLTADGRPIVGLSSKDLLELILSLDERCMLIPCHIWTPHFGIYGSASGFDSLEESFGDLAQYVYGIETGLSSDPDMNWQVPELMHRAILSFSDAHSAPKMSREATVMELEAPTYANLRKAIMRLSKSSTSIKGNSARGIHATSATDDASNRIVHTLEFYPEEGKYHFSGHRNCKVVYTPEDVRTHGVVCPVCGRGLTEGVFMRVEQLSDPKLFGRAVPKHDEHGVKWYVDKLGIQPPYVKLVPLLEIVAESLHSTVASQKSQQLFAKLCSEFESELAVLLRVDIGEVEKFAGWKLAESIQKVRTGDIAIDPGFDGVFGNVSIWREEEERQKAAAKAPQLRLEL